MDKDIQEKYINAFGNDINWNLAFDSYKESETTKHVHRLHPYKGKFIPQLVEYFLDSNTDDYKDEVYFEPGDIILDPFCGSGTTLIQANELGMDALGVDISVFNSMISNIKLSNVDFIELRAAMIDIENHISHVGIMDDVREFEYDLSNELKYFNKEFFPTHHFKASLKKGVIDKDAYPRDMEIKFGRVFDELLEKFDISNHIDETSDSYINRWYQNSIKKEISVARDGIKKYRNTSIRNVLYLILSRTVRSSRATSHTALTKLNKPVTRPYYCRKHYKLCKPLFSMRDWWRRYSIDTLRRYIEFKKVRTDTYQSCTIGDSRKVYLFNSTYNKEFNEKLREQKIAGIFTSPPYVGMIDYHEQHAYAYDILGLPRKDEFEIGSFKKGKSKAAIKAYVDDVSDVLKNSQKYMKDDFNIFIVANDKHDVYSTIAELAGLQIVKEFKRPVLNRAEGDGRPYMETIFLMRSR